MDAGLARRSADRHRQRALFAGYFELLARRRPLSSTREALEVGVAWLALTVAFESGFGRSVAHASWDELLADYDLRKGRLWPLVLAWIALGPAVVRARRGRCGRSAARTAVHADAGAAGCD